MMAHKELLCLHSPYIKQICQGVAPRRSLLDDLMRMRDNLQPYVGQNVANQMEAVPSTDTALILQEG